MLYIISKEDLKGKDHFVNGGVTLCSQMFFYNAVLEIFKTNKKILLIYRQPHGMPPQDIINCKLTEWSGDTDTFSTARITVQEGLVSWNFPIQETTGIEVE